LRILLLMDRVHGYVFTFQTHKYILSLKIVPFITLNMEFEKVNVEYHI